MNDSHDQNTPLIARQKKWGWFVLFTSSSTLLCCALPILLVTLGLGAVSATLFETLPILVTIAQNKLWMFVGSAVLLAFSGVALYRPGRHCPTDPVLAEPLYELLSSD